MLRPATLNEEIQTYPRGWNISILQISHEKNLLTFHYTGWLIGILIYNGLL